MKIAEKVYRRATQALPPTVAARIDLLRPSFRSSWGGPLNGQRQRRAMVRELAREIAFDRVLETGTYRGTTTEFFAAVFGTPVQTVEGNPRFHAYSNSRLARDASINVSMGDSRPFLRRLSAEHPQDTVFIYLDAHWEEDLPLREELEIIAAAWQRAVILVDDFAVPHDPGYAFDDYGPGKSLVEEYLPADALRGWSLYYPSAPSSAETGARRGSCALISPGLDVPLLTHLTKARTLS